MGGNVRDTSRVPSQICVKIAGRYGIDPYRNVRDLFRVGADSISALVLSHKTHQTRQTMKVGGWGILLLK